MNWAARLFRGLKLATGLVSALGARSAWALGGPQAIEHRIHLSRAGSCPAEGAVAGEIWSLTPKDRRDVLDELRDVSIEDLDATYRVIVTTAKGTKERVYPGVDRDCEKRARFVAVFVVLTLMPPDGQAAEENPEEPTPIAPPPETSAPKTASDPAGAKWFRLELGALAEQGLLLDRASGVHYIGGSLRALLGSSAFVPSFGVSYAPLAHFDAAAVRGDLARATVEAGVRARLRRASWELGGELGLVLAATRATATDLLQPANDTGVEVGAFGALVLAVPTRTAIEPFFAATARWIPMPHRLTVIPRGDVGALPQLWLGASAGLALRL